MKLKKYTFLIVLALMVNTITAQKYTNTDKETAIREWKGNTFSSSKSLIENLSEVSELSLLKRALTNVALNNSLEEEEMITVFAVSNNGFLELEVKHDSIFDVSKAKLLTAIIKYHVIPGRVDSYSIKKAVERNNGGTAYFATLEGEKLGIKEEKGHLLLVDAQGNTSVISATDFYHSNGFFHIVDGIVLPKSAE